MKLFGSNEAGEIFDLLVKGEDLKTILSESNNPDQLTLNDLGVPVLDNAYPILKEISDNDELNEKRIVENDCIDYQLTMDIAKVSAILADNIEMVFSKANFRGQRKLLPRNFLKTNKILRNKRIIDIGLSLDAAKELIEYGASVMVVSPYDAKTMLGEMEEDLSKEMKNTLVQSCIKMDTAEDFAEISRFYTHYHNPIDYLMIDRDGLYNHFVNKEETLELLLSNIRKQVEAVFMAVDMANYSSVAQIYEAVDPWKSADCEIFKRMNVKKQSLNWAQKSS